MHSEVTEVTVHVVDNGRVDRETTAELVRAMGLPCEAYASGLEFLDREHWTRPGCLIAEVRIPDVSGPQIQRRLRARGATLPVIFATAAAPIPVIVRAMRDGAVHFLQKPVDGHELWESVQYALRLDRQRRVRRRRQKQLRDRLATLSSEEQGVLEMVVDGMANHEIARRQDVCLRTVEQRRSRVMRKLAAGSVAELVRIALASRDGADRDALDGADRGEGSWDYALNCRGSSNLPPGDRGGARTNFSALGGS